MFEKMLHPPQNPRNLEELKVTRKRLKSDFRGLPQSNHKAAPKLGFHPKSNPESDCWGSKSYFRGYFWGNFGGDPESHFLVTFELLLTLRGGLGFRGGGAALSQSYVTFWSATPTFGLSLWLLVWEVAPKSRVRGSAVKSSCIHPVRALTWWPESQRLRNHKMASDCNRNSKKSPRLWKPPLKPTLWTRDPPVLPAFYSVSEASHRSGTPPEIVATTRVWFRIAAIFWPNAINFLWLRHCDFTAISAGKACDFEVVIANRWRFVIAIAWVTKAEP